MFSQSPVKKYAELIFPLSVAGTFTYAIPEELVPDLKVGCRVEVEFGKKKHYAALVKAIHDTPAWTKTKSILAIIDQEPIVSSIQLEFWEWLSTYYVCSLGEVMTAALPSIFKLASETRIYKLIEESDYPELLEDDEYLILEALDVRNELSISEVQQIIQKHSILKLINSMVDRRWIAAREKLEDKSEIPTISWIRIPNQLKEDQNLLNELLNQIQKSERQSRSFLNYLQIKKNYDWIKRVELQRISATDKSVTDALIKKGLYEECVLEKYVYPNQEQAFVPLELSENQNNCQLKIKAHWIKHQTSLLHGVTGSGKTMIYIKLIQEYLDKGLQVLYLVPEIALTTQLVSRLKYYFGEHLLEYHSDLGLKTKSAVWNAAMKHTQVFIGARSSIFLPFDRLGLIIVDEEHDASYKQNDPAPRYQARDSAIILAKLFNAKVLLGSATPSIESYYNAKQNKYGYTFLDQRFGESELPDVTTISLKEAQQFGRMKGLFSEQLLKEIQLNLDQKKQVILFRNRRGYSPLLQCANCNWEASCERCDVRMTLHKQQEKLKCHICGNFKPIPVRCPDCGQATLKILGFGTEKIEEELQTNFPDHIIKRLDLDIARTRKMQQKIIEEFQDREVDILVGTQMVTKGLDFDGVNLVAVVQVDQMLFYPDFRAQERAFQLLTQVGGRAGRRKEKGQVLIQGFQIFHPVIHFVVNHDLQSFYTQELFERKKFHYPPYVRLIKIQFLHTRLPVLEDAIDIFCKQLKVLYGKRILGPAEPNLSKIKGYFVRELLIKIEKESKQITTIKKEILLKIQELKSKAGMSSLRIQIDVDP